MTQYASIRDGIEAAINSVDDTGLVYDYFRYASNASSFNTLYTTTVGGVRQVRAWLIQWQGIEPVEESAFSEQTLLYKFEITGYRGLNDDTATEKEFADLVEDIMRAVMQKHTFSASGARVYSTNISGVTIGHATFAETLCHRARIGVTVEIDFAQSWS